MSRTTPPKVTELWSHTSSESLFSLSRLETRFPNVRDQLGFQFCYYRHPGTLSYKSLTGGVLCPSHQFLQLHSAVSAPPVLVHYCSIANFTIQFNLIQVCGCQLYPHLYRFLQVPYVQRLQQIIVLFHCDFHYCRLPLTSRTFS